MGTSELDQRNAVTGAADVSAGPWQTLLQDSEPVGRALAHYNASTIDHARFLLHECAHKGARAIAGGTDVMRLLEQRYAPTLPGVLVNLKDIPGLSYIREENGVLKIGALTCLSDIETSEAVRTGYGILSEAAGIVGSPQVRNMATIAGSLCQDVCCWYYKASGDYYHCLRKGGERCPAEAGDHRWMFSVFGPAGDCACYAACQSDMAIALAALEASIKTTHRTIPVRRFYASRGTVLEPDEIITEIQVPALPSGARGVYSKFSIRKSWDHPLTSVACVIGAGAASVVLGGVYFAPYVAVDAQEALRGKEITEALAETAAGAAVAGAVPLPRNTWKVEVTRVLVKRALLSLA